MRTIIFFLVFLSLIQTSLYSQTNGNSRTNSPDWLWMPTSTAREHAEREKARLVWFERKKIITAMAKEAARKQRLAKARQNRLNYHNRQNNYNRQNYRYRVRVRVINIQTPTGVVRYWVPY